MIIAISGIRDLHHDNHETVRNAMSALVYDPAVTEIRFGGAIGLDADALELAHIFGSGRAVRPRLTVIVPFTVREIPNRSALTVHAYADRVIEMNLPRDHARPFLARNDALLDGHGASPSKADRLVAFADGRNSGGTRYTINAAKKRGIDTRIVTVRGTKETR